MIHLCYELITRKYQEDYYAIKTRKRHPLASPLVKTFKKKMTRVEDQYDSELYYGDFTLNELI